MFMAPFLAQPSLYESGFQRFPWGLIALLSLIDIVLRGIALWKSARKGQKWWFFFLLVINSLTIVPGIYLLLNQEKQVEKLPKSDSSKRKKK